MSFEEQLYYNYGVSVDAYSDQPSARIDIDRLLQGLPAFVSSVTEFRKGKKTLILPACYFAALNSHQRLVIQVKLLKLQKKGFKVYIDKQDLLTELEDKDYKLTPLPIRPPDPVKLSRMLDCPRDELFVFDASQLQRFLLTEPDEWQAWVGQECISLVKDPIDTAGLRSLLEQGRSRLTTLNIGRLFNLRAEIGPDFRMEGLRELNLLPWIDNGLNCWVINPLPVINPNLVRWLLRNSPNLERLRLEERFDIYQSTDLLKDLVNPAALKEIGVYRLDNSSGSLEDTLVKMTRLKSLNLDIKPLDCSRLQAAQFQYLESIEASEFSLSLFPGCLPNPHKLECLDLKSLRASYPTANCNFTSLRRFSVYGGQISFQALEMLLNQADDLTELYLSHVTGLDEKCTGIFNLVNLKKLTLFDTPISPAQLAAWLNSAAQLEALSLDLKNILIDSFGVLKLAGLSQLTLYHASPNLLRELLAEVTAVDTLHISRLVWADDGWISPTISVKELNLSFCYFNSEATRNLFIQLQTCRKVVFTDVTFDLAISVDEMVCRDLEDFFLYDSNISTSQLNAILKNAPKLSRLFIENCANINPDLLDCQHIPNLVILGQATTNLVIDADTRPKVQQFKVDRQFLGKPKNPAPADLRHQVFDQFAVNPKPKAQQRAFILQHSRDDLGLEPVHGLERSPHSLFERYQSAGSGHYYGRWPMTLTKEWQPLPSYHAEETMKSYHCSANLPLEIAKSTRDSLYYVRIAPEGSIETCPTDLEVLLAYQPQASFDDLPDAVRDLAKYCRGFRRQALRTVDANASGPECLAALIKERAGACRHRVIVFKQLMTERFPAIQVRISVNAVHTYAEVFWNGHWIKCDLGGYPAQVQINERAMPQSANEAEPDLWDEQYTREVTEQVYSDTGRPLPPDFFKRARNLTTLRLQQATKYPEGDFSHLDTLKLQACALQAEQLMDLLSRTPKLKTLEISQCTMDAAEFAKLDLSMLQELEWVELSGSFIPDAQALASLKNTAHPRVQWQVDSPNIIEESLPTNIESILVKKGGRRLPQRYVPKAAMAANVVDLLSLLADPGWKTGLLNHPDPARLRLELQELAQKTGRPCYYVAAPAELRCRADYIGPDGIIRPGPGGPLYDFLRAHSHQPAVIMVNYNGFSPADLAKFNSLLDEAREIEGIPIPPPCKIIGLIDQSHPDAYTGADFYSRFEIKRNLQLTLAAVDVCPRTDPIFENRQPDRIELCGGGQWQAQLIGHWLIHGDQLIFKEGALLKAVKAGQQAFVLNNAPTTDPAFQRFVQDIRLHGGLFHQGRMLTEVGPEFELRFDDQLQFDSLGAFLQLSTNSQHEEPIQALNEALLAQFLGQYELDPTGRVVLQPGLIEARAGETLPVLLTHSITAYQWLQILQQCQQFKTRIELSLAPGVALPRELLDGRELSYRVMPAVSHTQFLSGSERPLIDGESIWIDIRDVAVADLLDSLPATYSETEHRFAFNKKAGFLPQALAAGATVILQGDWPPQLAQALQALVLARLQQREAQGRLLIMSETATPFSSMTPATEIPRLPSQLEPIQRQASFDQRLTAVEAILQERPFVLLTGATGVGKTWFVQKQWMQSHPHCHYGEDQILDWIQDARPGFKTLFIDEANLSSRNWSEFEGLFNQPPTLFYQGVYYRLTPEHKVIFAGNPLTYGGERQLPSLFKRHPCELEFKPLPAKFLVADLGLDEVTAQPLINLIDWMNQQEASQILLTFREIQMMASLIKLALQQHPEIPPGQMARYLAYSLSQVHVPEASRKVFEEKFFEPPAWPLPAMDLPGFVINQTNQAAILALSQHLALRQARCNRQADIPATGGLGGLILEGPPGVGKSHLVAQMLVAQGLREGIDFYRIPVSLSPKDKSAILYRAFHAGKIVIFEEINSAQMSERELNAYLEGHDLAGFPAQQPGFMLIGTQNPIEFAGRIKQTLPLKHRLQTVKIPDYTPAEIAEILMHIGLPPRIAQDMRDEFFHRQKEDPSLCFRDLEKIARQWLRHQGQRQEISLPLAALPQVGSICKTVALANVEAWYAQTLGYDPMPLWSRQRHIPSIRKLVKANGSAQGEILEFARWQQSLEQMGFDTEVIDFKEDVHRFLSSILDNLHAGHIPMLAFPIFPDSRMPDVEPLEPDETEHAVLVSAYNPRTDELTLVHSGQAFKVDLVTLFNACHASPQTRKPEFYQRNPRYAPEKKDSEAKYLPTTAEAGNADRSSILPREDTGFRAKMLVVKKPASKEALLAKRVSEMSAVMGRERYGLFPAVVENSNTTKCTELSPPAKRIKK